MDVDDLPDVDTESASPRDIIQKHFVPLLLGILGVIFVGLGIFFSKGVFQSDTGVTVIESSESSSAGKVVVEVGGAVEKPGVYELSSDSRVGDALESAGGLTSSADAVWVTKTINKAAKITDGQKIYIPSIDEQTNTSSAKSSSGSNAGNEILGSSYSSLININTASAKQLESLWGIGPKIAQKVIEQRPYSSIEELVSKRLISSSVFERIKDQVSVY